MLLKVDCLPNAVGKQPSIPLIYLGRKWTLNWWWWWWWWVYVYITCSFFCSSMVIRDLTLRSAASFGSFHLIRLLYDEYMFYLVEHKVATALGETSIAVMGEVRQVLLILLHILVVQVLLLFCCCTTFVAEVLRMQNPNLLKIAQILASCSTFCSHHCRHLYIYFTKTRRTYCLSTFTSPRSPAAGSVRPRPLNHRGEQLPNATVQLTGRR